MTVRLSEISEFSKGIWKEKMKDIDNGSSALNVTITEERLRNTIAERFDIASSFSIDTRMKALIEFGFIRRHPKHAGIFEVCINGQKNKFDNAEEDRKIDALTETGG